MDYKNKHKNLLILDLDETLIHAREKPLERKESFKVSHFFIYERPYLKEFLASIKKNFFIAVWSSASDDYVKEVTAHIFPKDYPLEFVWGRSRCTPRSHRYEENFGRYLEDYSNQYYYIKLLQKLKRKGFTMEKILIVDDSPEKCINNYGNAIYPKIYLGNEADDELTYLVQYLDLLKDENNVRSIEKRGWRSRIELNQ